jgi:hypothetical protein
MRSGKRSTIALVPVPMKFLETIKNQVPNIRMIVIGMLLILTFWAILQVYFGEGLPFASGASSGVVGATIECEIVSMTGFGSSDITVTVHYTELALFSMAINDYADGPPPFHTSSVPVKFSWTLPNKGLIGGLAATLNAKSSLGVVFRPRQMLFALSFEEYVAMVGKSRRTVLDNGTQQMCVEWRIKP